MSTQKIYLKEKKSEVVFLLDMNDLDFRICSHREVRENVKTVHFGTFLQHRVI